MAAQWLPIRSRYASDRSLVPPNGLEFAVAWTRKLNVEQAAAILRLWPGNSNSAETVDPATVKAASPIPPLLNTSAPAVAPVKAWLMRPVAAISVNPVIVTA